MRWPRRCRRLRLHARAHTTTPVTRWHIRRSPEPERWLSAGRREKNRMLGVWRRPHTGAHAAAPKSRWHLRRPPDA
jgi:hypothetical protein